MLGLMTSLPFLQPWHDLPLTSFHAEWLAAFCGLLGMLFLLPRPAASPLRIPAIAAAPLALLAIALLQLAGGMFAYPASGILLVLYLAWAAGLSIAGRTLAASLGSAALPAHLAWAMLAGGLASAAFGLLQYLGWWQAFGGLVNPPAPVTLYGVYGNLAQQNHFASYLALALAGGMYLGFTQRLAPRWLAACCLPLLAALALSGSRSILLYLGWLLGAGMLQAPGTGRLHRWLRLAAVALPAAAIALALAARATPLGAPLTRLVSPEGALGPRLYLWDHALQMFAAHPWLGIGFDGFAQQLETQLTAPTRWGIDQYAHNLPLQLLAAAGLPGALALAMPAALLAWRLWRRPRTMERMFACAVLGILLIHSLLEQPLYYAYFLGIAALFAGLADPSGKPLPSRPATGAVAMLVLTLLLFTSVKTARDYGAVRAQFEGGEAAADQALRVRTLQHLRSYSLLAPLSELIAPEIFVPADAPVAARRALNARLLRFAPTDEVAFRHAALLAEEGRMAEAQAQLRRAAFSYPQTAPLYLARIRALAAAEPAVYGALAAYGAQLAR
jgi:O-antigen ligase